MSAIPSDEWPPLRHPERLLAAGHAPGPVKDDEYPYPRDCLGCGAPWPCAPELRRRSREEGERKAERDRERRRRASASRAGLRALVTVGTTVYSSTHKDSQERPRGGVVVEVAEDVDPETGDMERRWTCLDVFDHPIGVHVVSELEVHPSDIAATDTSTLAILFYRLAWETWKMGRPRRTDGRIMRTSIDTKVMRQLRWMLTLAKQLTG